MVVVGDMRGRLGCGCNGWYKRTMVMWLWWVVQDGDSSALVVRSTRG